MTCMLRLKGRQRKQNGTLAGMSTKSDVMHTIKATSVHNVNSDDGKQPKTLGSRMKILGETRARFWPLKVSLMSDTER